MGTRGGAFRLERRAQVEGTFIGSIERAERNVSIDNIEKISLALGVAGWSLLKPG